MAFKSGNGGSVTVGNIVLDIASWEGDFGARLTEVTNSGSGGGSKFHKVIEEASWTIDIPWDELKLPDVDVGLLPGNDVTIKFKLGASAKFYLLTGTTVEKANPTVNNANDIVRMRCSGKGGVRTEPLTG